MAGVDHQRTLFEGDACEPARRDVYAVGRDEHEGAKIDVARGDATVHDLDALTQTLRRYRDGTGNRVDALMAANTRGMSDSDIQAVVAYVTAMR